MAKKTDADSINKTELIKEALAQDPNARPKAVAASLGHGITARYVSTIKTNLRNGPQGSTKKKPARTLRKKPAAANTAPAVDSLESAIAYVEAVGGLKAAKQQIETIERIKSL